MGRVYLGSAPTGPVAIKRVRPDLAKDEKFLIRFGQELENQGRLPAGVSPRLLATDRTARPPWFATEYIPGVTLDQAVDLTGGCLPVSDCWILLRELAARLHALADLGMVHRDLKPSNIMLTADGVRLIDFGLSLTLMQTRVTSVNGTVGTPPFMAPEQLSVVRPSPTPAVDVFALGGVITYAATGEPPFGYDPAVGYRIEHQEPHLDALREADPALAAVAASCLEKDPANRPTAAELSGARTAPVPSWPDAVTDRISSLRSIFPLQPDTPGPADEPPPGAEPPLTAPTAALADLPTGETAPASLATSPEPPGSHQLVSPRSGSRRRPSHRRTAHRSMPRLSVPNRFVPPGKRRWLMLILILLIIAGGGSATALSLSPLMQPRPRPTPVAATSQPTISPRPRPSPAHPKHRPAHSPTPAPSAPVAVPTQAQTSRRPGVVSFASYDMLENKALHLCLADKGNYAVAMLSCTGGSSEGWKAAAEPDNSISLTDKAYGFCLNDSYSMVSAYPCPTTTYWQVGSTTSAGATLVETGTGECISAALVMGEGGLTTAACNPSDPSQLWYDAGKT